MTDLRTAGLDEWVKHHAEFSARVFNDLGSLTAMWVAQTKDGMIMPIMAPLADKDQILMAIKMLFREKQVIRYVFMTEAWILESKTKEIPESIKRGAAVSSHPDRREIIMVTAEDRDGTQLMGHMYILRPEHGKPTVSPFKLLDGFANEGRFAKLLEQS